MGDLIVNSESRWTVWERSCFIDLFLQELQELMITKVVEVQYLNIIVFREELWWSFLRQKAKVCTFSSCLTSLMPLLYVTIKVKNAIDKDVVSI